MQSLRWRAGQHSWRRPEEGGFRSQRYDVAALSESAARSFVVEHHYSRSYPAARLRYGLYDGVRLVGVAVLSVPVRAAVLTAPFPDLVPYGESLELGRFVLEDAVPANGESWFLARLFELAAAEAIRGVVSFSDPVARRRANGSLVMPGHIGTIYQASNAVYCGRGRARLVTLLPDGTLLNDRSAAKVAAGHRGHEAVERQLVRFGAAHRRPGQSGAEWLAGSLVQIGARRVRHGGNHRYAFVMGSSGERRALRGRLSLLQQPYPKSIDLEIAA